MFRLPGIGGTLTSACGKRPGTACRLVWDVTHDKAAAKLTSSYLAAPVIMALRIAFILVLALIVRAVVHRMIRKLTQRGANLGASRLDTAHLLRGERRHQRAQALGSVLSNAASVIIFGIAGITIAGDLGVNLAPVLASAGVLGIAVGFGAQSLVRDFLAGIFMLLEDQYGVGDVIDAGEATGTVEAVSLRTTRLRDVSGIVWYVRNGTINRIGNKSQSWARAVIDFPVPYDHDLGRVRKLMKEVALQLWNEPRWHDLILEEPEIWGVELVYRDAVVMRLVAKTLPLRQWEVARELRARLKMALDLPDEAPGPAITAPDGPPDAAPTAAPAAPSAVTVPTATGAPATAAAPTMAKPAGSGNGGAPAADGGKPAGT
jgi:small conductance mechanosensitive channel